MSTTFGSLFVPGCNSRGRERGKPTSPEIPFRTAWTSSPARSPGSTSHPTAEPGTLWPARAGRPEWVRGSVERVVVRSRPLEPVCDVVVVEPDAVDEDDHRRDHDAGHRLAGDQVGGVLALRYGDRRPATRDRDALSAVDRVPHVRWRVARLAAHRQRVRELRVAVVERQRDVHAGQLHAAAVDLDLDGGRGAV